MARLRTQYSRDSTLPLSRKGSCIGFIVLCGLWLAQVCLAQSETAQFRVSNDIIATPAPVISATVDLFGNGSLFIPGGGFEPKSYRTWFVASQDAPADDPGRVIARHADLNQNDTLRNGALDGASVSVLRLSGGEFESVREGIVPSGGFQLSDWALAHQSQKIIPAPTTSFQLYIDWWERGGQQRWFTVRAIDRQGHLSEYAQPVAINVPAQIAKREARRNRTNLQSMRFGVQSTAQSNAPPAPQNLRAQITPQGVIDLQWDPADRDVAGYVVYTSRVAPRDMQGVYMRTAGQGGAVRAGDLVIIRKHLAQYDRRAFLSDRIWNSREGRLLNNTVLKSWPREHTHQPWELRSHPVMPLRDWGGRSYLSVNLDGRAPFDLRAFNHSGTDQDNFEVLDPNLTYRVSVRLRGAQKGTARFLFTGPYARTVEPIILHYTDQWQEVTASFSVPNTLEKARPVGEMVLQLTGPGRVDVDDFRVYRTDTDFQDFTRTEYDQLRNAGISALRTHGLTRSGRFTYDLRSLVDLSGIERRNGQYPSLHRILATMKKGEISPWLQIEPHFSDTEWLGLIEYLAAPFDPNIDKVHDRPWAALRVAQGRARPWTDSFDEIYFELGNETWNRLFLPWVFPSLPDAQTGQKASAGEVYGAFQTRVSKIMRSSPWWNSAGLEDKVQFVIGGRNWTDYGTQAAKTAPKASDILAVAAYNGGWDEDEGPPSLSPASYFNVLNQVSQATIVNAQRYQTDALTLQVIQDRALALGTYEAGPGYVLNGLNNARVSEQEAQEQEYVMKSQASGVATLDSFLAQRVYGFSLQNFFMFADGPRWTSHTPWYKGDIAHPSWALLSLLNAHGSGSLLQVDDLGGPRQDLAQVNRRQAVSQAPQVAVYATRTDQTLTLFVLSRRVPNYPVSGSEGCSPVSIQLPFGMNVSSARLIRTMGSYNTHTVEGTPLPLKQSTIHPSLFRNGFLTIDPSTGGAPCGLPPASAFIYVLYI